MVPVAVAAGAALIAFLMLGIIELTERRRSPAEHVVQLHFGRDVTGDAVVALLDGLAGLPAGTTVAFEVRSEAEQITHYLRADQATIDTLNGRLRALLPSVRCEPASVAPTEGYGYGRTVRLRGHHRVLRDDLLAETSASLLAALFPLGATEAVLVRWQVRPSRAEVIPDGPNGRRLGTEARRRLHVKNEGAVLRCRGVVAVRSGHPDRARHLIGRVVTMLRSRSTPYGHLRTSPRSGWWLRHELGHGRFVLGDRYNARELAGLLAWPIEAPTLPGLHLGTALLLMPSGRLPRTGRLLGKATWPGDPRPVYQPVVGALSHSLIAGGTGVGKSTLVTGLIETDIATGRGLVLIDGKGDTASAVLSRLSPGRAADVIVLDCASAGPLPGIRLFGDGDPELAADVVLGVLSELFRDSWGPLSERYLRAAVNLVAHDPQGTLADAPYVFTDAAYRRRLVPKVADPLTRATLAALDAMSAGERAHQLAAPMNRLGTLLSRPVVRNVLGQPSPKLDFAKVMREKRIVVVSLAPARVGSAAAQLIGAVCLYALVRAVQGRSRLPDRARHPFFVYLDEPKALGRTLPLPLDLMLEQFRGLGCGVVISPQSVFQLSAETQRALLTNSTTRIAFRQEADDARLLARDLPGVSPEDLGELGQYEVVARVGLGPGDVAPPVTLKTPSPSKAVGDPNGLRAASSRDYGLSLAQVDEQLAARHRATAQAPVGRKPRRQT